jgi:hypothetical protein
MNPDLNALFVVREKHYLIRKRQVEKKLENSGVK